MEFQLYDWMQEYMAAAEKTFADRVWFLGLQGSYARGEATKDSDIDVVLILDKLLEADLRVYRDMLDALPYREKVCGFVSGRAELEHWAKPDLFQFCFDTIPLKGSLEEIAETVTKEDIREAIHTGACNIYHGACHNLLHDRKREITAELYKAAVFVLQAKDYLETGRYARKRAELLAKLSGEDREILCTAMEMKGKPAKMEEDLDTITWRLVDWASHMICAAPVF